ncbi:hypothetical protein P7C70_g8121, partial [Phenoliferia sp. Uapishka_3]
MKSTTLLAALAASASSALAFESTFPILAWSSSDAQLASLSLLSPSHPSHSPPTIFRPSAQSPFPPPSQSSDSASSDLCTLSSILLVSAPGIHASDLSLLPSSSLLRSQSPSFGIPYVPTNRNGETARKFVESFAGECGAMIGGREEKSFWAGVDGEQEGVKRVSVEVVDGLGDWELTGGKARSMRRGIMENIGAFAFSVLASFLGWRAITPCPRAGQLSKGTVPTEQNEPSADSLPFPQNLPDELIQSHLASLPAPHLIILTSVPSLSANKAL